MKALVVNGNRKNIRAWAENVAKYIRQGDPERVIYVSERESHVRQDGSSELEVTIKEEFSLGMSIKVTRTLAKFNQTQTPGFSHNIFYESVAIPSERLEDFIPKPDSPAKKTASLDIEVQRVISYLQKAYENEEIITGIDLRNIVKPDRRIVIVSTYGTNQIFRKNVFEIGEVREARYYKSHRPKIISKYILRDTATGVNEDILSKCRT